MEEKVHISIPGLDSEGLTYEEFFRVLFLLVKHEVAHLKDIYPSCSIDDIKAYPLQIAQRIVNTSCTLHNIIEREKDFCSAMAILRVITDTLSSLYLIYKEEGEKLYLRHYLYVMDGVNNRLKYLPNSMDYDNKISKSEYDALCKQIESSKNNCNETINHCVSEIHSLSLYHGQMYVINKLIKSQNWKFKTFGSANKNNSYSWLEMYEKLKLQCDPTFFSYLSEFVHGLSISNIAVDIDNTTFEPIYGMTLTLLGRLHDFIECYYCDELPMIRPKLISGLLDNDMPQKYVENFMKKIGEQVTGYVRTHIK